MNKLNHPASGVRGSLVLFQSKKKSSSDNRKKVAWAVFEYIGSDRQPYRKAFEMPVGAYENDFLLAAPLFDDEVWINRA